MSSLFRMAVMNGLRESVNAHLAGGISVDAVDGQGRTPLMLAALRGHVELCELLLSSGADPSLTDVDGVDAASYADKTGNLALASTLRTWMDRQLEAPDPVEGYDTEFGQDGEICESSSLGEWITEEEIPPPPDDPNCQTEARAIQQRISLHEIIDLDEDWSDIEIDLPDAAELAAWQRMVDRGKQERLRPLLLEALREGCLPLARLTSFAAGDEDSADPPESLVRLLQRFLADHGIVITDDHVDDEWAPSAMTTVEAVETDEGSEALLDELREVVSTQDDPGMLHLQDIARQQRLSPHESQQLFRQLHQHQISSLATLISCPPVRAAFLELLSAFEDGEANPGSYFGEGINSEKFAVGADVLDDEDDDTAQKIWLTGGPLKPGLEKIRRFIESFNSADTGPASEALASLKPAPALVMHLKESADAITLQNLSVIDEKMIALRNRLVAGNLGLSAWVAKKRGGLEFADRIQAAHIGLMKAVERFDPERGNQFSTYAVWWMRQLVSREVDDTSRLIRIPVHAVSTLRKIERARNSLSARYGVDPSPEILADTVGVTKEKLIRMLDADYVIIDLELPGDEVPIAESMESEFEAPDDAIDRHELQKYFKKIFARIKPRDADILRKRFGIDESKSYTLEEIGQELGVTRERIRQIEKKALKRLGHPSIKRKLAMFR